VPLDDALEDLAFIAAPRGARIANLDLHALEARGGAA
jgi:hypothetical protein